MRAKRAQQGCGRTSRRFRLTTTYPMISSGRFRTRRGHTAVRSSSATTCPSSADGQDRPGSREAGIAARHDASRRGCGWGSVMKRAVEKHDVNVIGLTLNKNQSVYCQHLLEELDTDRSLRGVPARLGGVRRAGRSHHQHRGVRGLSEGPLRSVLRDVLPQFARRAAGWCCRRSWALPSSGGPTWASR